MVSIAEAALKDDFAERIMKSIEDDVILKSNAIFERHKEQIIEELAEVRSEVVASAALRIAKYSSIQYLQDRIVIEVIDRTKE